MSDARRGPVTVIWTDFGGVLTPPINDALLRVAEAAGVPPEELLGAMRRVAARGNGGLLESLERGQISEREWGGQLAEELAPRWTPRVDLGRFGEYWYANRPFNVDLYDRLVAVRGRGVRLGLLTNSVREWEAHRAAMIPDQSVFDGAIKSHEIGLRKPEPEIYQLAERTFAVEPTACLLIDDMDVNCAAAAARGWLTIHHVDTRKTLAELEDLLDH